MPCINVNAKCWIEFYYGKIRKKAGGASNVKESNPFLAVLGLTPFVSQSIGATDHPRNIILFGWDGRSGARERMSQSPGAA
jgi:hypothetical protein